MNGFAREAGGYAAHAGLIDVAGKRAMGYYDDSQIPYYYFLATQFATADRFFSPLMSKSEPKHLYSYAATSQGWITVPQGQLSSYDFQSAAECRDLTEDLLHRSDARRRSRHLCCVVLEAGPVQCRNLVH